MVKRVLKVLEAVDCVVAIGGQDVAKPLCAVAGGIADVSEIDVMGLVGVRKMQPDEIVVDGPDSDEGEAELYLQLVVTGADGD